MFAPMSKNTLPPTSASSFNVSNSFWSRIREPNIILFSVALSHGWSLNLAPQFSISTGCRLVPFDHAHRSSLFTGPCARPSPTAKRIHLVRPCGAYDPHGGIDVRGYTICGPLSGVGLREGWKISVRLWPVTARIAPRLICVSAKNHGNPARRRSATPRSDHTRG